MDVKHELEKIGLTPNNSVVIGSGILSALAIRNSNDIDLVVDEEAYARLLSREYFRKVEKHGRVMLADNIMEIGTYWGVLNKNWGFKDLLDVSVVVDGVRYITLEFLLAVKKSWLLDADVRQKDIEDVKRIEEYLKDHKAS